MFRYIWLLSFFALFSCQVFSAFDVALIAKKQIDPQNQRVIYYEKNAKELSLRNFHGDILAEHNVDYNISNAIFVEGTDEIVIKDTFHNVRGLNVNTWEELYQFKVECRSYLFSAQYSSDQTKLLIGLGVNNYMLLDRASGSLTQYDLQGRNFRFSPQNAVVGLTHIQYNNLLITWANIVVVPQVGEPIIIKPSDLGFGSQFKSEAGYGNPLATIHDVFPLSDTLLLIVAKVKNNPRIFTFDLQTKDITNIESNYDLVAGFNTYWFANEKTLLVEKFSNDRCTEVVLVERWYYEQNRLEHVIAIPYEHEIVGHSADDSIVRWKRMTSTGSVMHLASSEERAWINVKRAQNLPALPGHGE